MSRPPKPVIESKKPIGTRVESTRLREKVVRMTPAALGLALAAACVHAVWNVLLARSPDVEGATAAALPVGLVVFAPAAIAWWRVQGAAVPFVVGSSTLE